MLHPEAQYAIFEIRAEQQSQKERFILQRVVLEQLRNRIARLEVTLSSIDAKIERLLEERKNPQGNFAAAATGHSYAGQQAMAAGETL
jgi:hypothetical protein